MLLKQAINALVSEFAPRHPHFGDWIRNNHTDFVDGTRSIYRIIETNKCVGYFLTHLFGRYAKANALLIFREYRGRGYGQRTLALFKEECRMNGYVIIYGQCRNEYEKTMHILSKVGFVEIGLTLNKIEHMENILFALPLTTTLSNAEIEAVASKIYENVEFLTIRNGEAYL